MQKSHYYLIGGVLLIVALLFVAALWISGSGKPVPTIADPSSLAGLQTGGGPWIAELTNLKARLNAIGLPALTAEGNTLHIHQHLDIYVNGIAVPVPAFIGIDPNKKFISPLHVHDTTQVIHVESPTVQDFTLGQFFDVWGVRLTDTCIGIYCSVGDKKLRVYSNGQEYTGNPRELVLTAHQEIVVTFGTPSELPQPIPKSYTFPAGE